MEDKKALTSPCGLDCFNCDIHESNLTDDLAELIHVKMGVPKEQIACKGCRQQDGNHYHMPQGCATLDCVKAKGVAFCSECNEFPCVPDTKEILYGKLRCRQGSSGLGYSNTG